MPPRAQNLLTRIDRQRRTVLAEVGALSAERLMFRPAPGSWSALDVVEHLVKVEEGIVSRVRKREPRTWREAARAKASLGLMSVYFALGRKFKVPTQAVLPLGGTTLADLSQRWEESQTALRSSIEQLAPREHALPMMRHPVLGLLTAAETLTFVLRHIAHHHRQIARIRRAPGYPGA
jgi:uncharacterized damage-inducible protein DinB